MLLSGLIIEKATESRPAHQIDEQLGKLMQSQAQKKDKQFNPPARKKPQKFIRGSSFS